MKFLKGLYSFELFTTPFLITFEVGNELFEVIIFLDSDENDYQYEEGNKWQR